MQILVPLWSLSAVLTSLLTKSASQPPIHSRPTRNMGPEWIGMLPPTPTDPMVQGSMVSACTFAVGPPGPDLALCPAFLKYCYSYKQSRSPDALALKTRPLRMSSGSPLDYIRFRAGCTGGSDVASDGTYISGYTASCIVDGTEWVSMVFDEFIRAQFSEDGTQDPAIYYSFVGCQVPAHHA